MEMTAERSSIAHQFEVLVKVKQKDNPEFSFLYPENELNAFYCFLKGKHTKETSHDSDCSSNNSFNAPTGLAGLINYGSSSDDDDCASEKSTSGTLVKEDKKELVERRAKRLKQAQKLKEHFAKKLKE